MVVTSKVVDELLEDGMQNTYDNYLYVQIATGTTDISTGQTILDGSTQIGVSAALYNKTREVGTIDSFIDGRRAVYKFKITTGEPNVQPVNIGQIGLMKVLDDSGGLGIGGKFPVTSTKDNLSQWVSRCEVRYRRIDE